MSYNQKNKRHGLKDIARRVKARIQSLHGLFEAGQETLYFEGVGGVFNDLDDNLNAQFFHGSEGHCPAFETEEVIAALWQEHDVFDLNEGGVEPPLFYDNDLRITYSESLVLLYKLDYQGHGPRCWVREKLGE